MHGRNHLATPAAAISPASSLSSFVTARSRPLALILWILAFAAIPVWTAFDHPGWDIVFYRNAITALHAGHDPYLDAMAVQEAFHRTLAQHPNDIPPFSYVYSPMTLPLLRLIGTLPVWFSGGLYWLAIAVSTFIPLFVVWRAAEPADLTFCRIVAPVAIFFPGLLAQDTVLSGNIAFILYALIFLGAARGWWRGRWLWCYLAILLASCFKAPLLCLVVVPLLSARRQWIPAGLTTIAGATLFAVQSLIWPSMFVHFLQAVQLQFTYNRDFGSSPAGVFGTILTGHGVSYTPLSELFYALYAVVVFASLLYLSRQFLSGRFSLGQWIPVLLLGVALLNPRLMEYDLAPLALPMGLIGWRFIRRISLSAWAVVLYFSVFLAANVIAVGVARAWKPIECVLLISFFAAGCWQLLQFPRHALAQARASDDTVPQTSNTTEHVLSY
jgi:hypothetical protein